MEFLCFLLWAFFSIAKYLRYNYGKHCCDFAFPSSFLPLRGDEKRWIEHLLAPCKKSYHSLGFWIPRYRFRIPGSGYRSLCPRNWDSGFHSLVGSVILSCIPDSKTQDSGFHGFQISGIPQAKTSQIPVFCLTGNNPVAWVNKHLPLAQYFLTKFWSPRYLRPQTDPASSVSV